MPTLLPLQSELDRLVAAGPEGVPALADWLLAEGSRRGASDLHVEPRGGEALLRWRIDGCLADAGRLRGPLHANLIQRLKVLAGLLTYRTDVPQDGRIGGTAATGATDMRVSVYPAVLGEKVVVRFFQRRDPAVRVAGEKREALELADLGLETRDAERLESYLARPQGLLLLTGPAGSGKSTTLYAALARIVTQARGQRQIVTIEDPVERVLDGVTHTELRPAAGLDYPAALKALLRQDPEVLMIGEIRDAETAQVAVQAALTGHLILSTVHAPSAPEVLLRLLHLGIEPYLAASTVGAVLEQRLLRRLCAECKRPESDGAKRESGVEAESFCAVGCEACAGTGYRGRLLVAELLAVEGALRAAVLERADGAKLLGAAAGAGWRGLWARGLEKRSQGLTTQAELRRVLTPVVVGPGPY